MIKAAEQDGVTLKLNDAFREFGEQLSVRDRNKTKQFTEDELKNNSSKLYNPETAKPGWGFHTYGNAFDFATANGTNKAYKWLVKNAFTYGFIRTVKSETWHWEYKPWTIGRGSNSQFALVSKDHSSWRGLV
jgi:LAS superfamily LD-carboxypeptidase LdcB